jgi:tRNA(Ile)-lysidine synthase
LVKDREVFLLLPVEEENTEEEPYSIQSGDIGILEIPFRMEISSFCQKRRQLLIQPDKHIAYLDRDKLHFPLILRKWRSGDKFIPFGMKGFQKLSDFFNNNKISKPEKEKIWLLLSGEDIVWVVNHRIDDRYKINKDTENVYVLKNLK